MDMCVIVGARREAPSACVEGANGLESLQGFVYFVTYSATVPNKRPDYAEVELLWKQLLLGSTLQGSVPHSM